MLANAEGSFFSLLPTNVQQQSNKSFHNILTQNSNSYSFKATVINALRLK
jgi:hypothetical protein